MLVSYVVLCFIIPAYQATPLYLEINHRDPQTGEVLSTTELEIESDILDDENSQPQISPPPDEQDLNQIAALEYYYGCSMPLPPPIERSNVEEVEYNIGATSPNVIETSNSNLNVREPDSIPDSVLDSAIAGVNSVALQIMSLGFRAFNRFV